MANRVEGIRLVSYDNKQGKHVEGAEIVFSFESKNYDGRNFDRQYVSSGVIARMGGLPSRGEEFTFTYGQDYKTKKAYVTGWEVV